ncbi:MAG TPA: hypothetical protein VM368_05555 [Flavisolibacter sp.]|nr:hypothetical protein [Flavisolibacter sp.]
MSTIVLADREDNSGPGDEPYVCGTRTNQSICYTTVTVDDAYAEVNPTHIVGVGAEPATPQGTTEANQVYMVFIGDALCSVQYDNFISFTGNGGGSEINFIRGDGYMTLDGNGQINSPQNTVRVNFKRKEIRNQTWKTINAIWDSNWELDNKEQLFGIYEDDTQGSSTFNASVKTTVKDSAGNSVEGTVGFSITVKTQDALIRQLSWNRESFYLYNQGGLNNGCSTRNGFTIYDCFTGVRYTMPTQ